MSTPPRRLPSWLLERLALGELPDPLPDFTRRRLDAAPSWAEDQTRLHQENAAFLTAHPPAEFIRRLRSRQPLRPSPSFRWPALGLALAVAAAVMVIVVHPPTSGELEDERTKGLAPALSIFRKREAGPELLGDGAHVRSGDVLQLRYRAAGYPYGVILSVDGAHQITVHLPDAQGATKLRPSGETPLPNAYRLDAAPRFERFLFVTSNRPLSSEEMTAATREWAQAGFPGSGPRFPRGTRLSTVTLLKDAP